MASRLFATPWLRRKRLELGYKQSEMAQVLSLIFRENISGSLYQKWEQQRKPVTMQKAVAIARELDVKLTDLWATKE